MLNNPKVKAYNLLEEIKELSGVKIVTVCSDEDAVAFDIDEDGQVGYIPSHLVLCLKLIEDSLHTSGSIVIRQFTKIKMDVETSKGIMSIPIKRLYGIYIANNTYRGLSKDALSRIFAPANEAWIERTEVFCDCTLNG